MTAAAVPPKPARPGLGARLEDRFRPKIHWGVEFTSDQVRLQSLKEAEGKVIAGDSFVGSFAEVEAFARSHGLAFQGLHAAVSHIPFKLNPVETADEESALQAENVRPVGLAAEALDIQLFVHGEEKLLLMARDEAVRGFCESLPGPLSSLWSLAPSPLAMLPFLSPPPEAEAWAALLPDQTHTHVLFFRGFSLDAYVKLFVGFQDVAASPKEFARELKKALVYHYASRFPETAVEAVQIWREGQKGEMAAALSSFGMRVAAPGWPLELQALPETFRVAGALALQALHGREPYVSFSVPTPALPSAKRRWMRRSGQVAGYGYRVFIVLAAMVAAFAVAALGLRWVVETKARTWSGELRKWDQFQQSKEEVAKQLGGLQGMLARRTHAYAALQAIGASLPAEVWLESWETEVGEQRAIAHKLEGYALAESRIPEFLSALEQGHKFKSVKLKSTERIRGEVAEKKTGIAANRKDLVKFQVGVVE